MVSDKLYDAMQYAFALHGRDERKGSRVLYVTHLFSVCGLVLQDGGTLDEAIAALLHDALEDKPQETSAVEIEGRFGANVLEIVRVCTDTEPGYAGGKKEEWSLRKQRYLEHVRCTLPEMLRVSLADKVDNARSILADHARIGDELWKKFNAGRDQQLWYYTELRDAYEQVGVKGPLMDEFRMLVEQIRQL
jgi:(p)ppGpp synthase/HD superfamily hydrolase